MKVASALIAAGHQKPGIGEPIFQEGIQNAINRTAGAGQNLDVERNNGCSQCRRNGAAYQDVHSQDRQAPCPAQGILGAHFDCNPPRLPAVFNIYQKKAAGGVKYRGDASLPLWNRNFHYIADVSNAYANPGRQFPAGSGASPGPDIGFLLLPEQGWTRDDLHEGCRMQWYPAGCIAICTFPEPPGMDRTGLPEQPPGGLPSAVQSFAENRVLTYWYFSCKDFPQVRSVFCFRASTISTDRKKRGAYA